MKKLIIGGLCLLLALVFGNAMIVSGQSDDQMCIPMGTITLQAPESVEATRPAVQFPHPAHFSYNCQTCHHQWEMDAPIVSCTTSGCHDGTVAPTRSKKGVVDEEAAVAYYKTAFHKRCIGCHREMKIERKKLEMSGRTLNEKVPETGPTTCRGCHQPEE